MKSIRKIIVLIMLLSLFSSVVYAEPAIEDVNYAFQQLFDLGSTSGYSFAQKYLNFQGKNNLNYSKFDGNYKGIRITTMYDNEQKTIAVAISGPSYNQFNDIANMVASKFGSGQYINRLRSNGYEEYVWQISRRYTVEVLGYSNGNTDIMLNGNFFISMW